MRAVVTPVLSLSLLASLSAHAADDGTHGRTEGDLSIVLGLGAVVAPRGPRALADVRFRYLDTLGAFADYEDGFGSSSDPRRVFALGLEVRPLFLGRWLQGHEWRSARADLTFDSLGLELGAFFAEPRGTAFGPRPGFQLGLGLETPVFAHANGPWLAFHGALRWSDAVLGGGRIDGPADRALLLSVTLAWHQFFGAHTVDNRPPR